MAWRCRVCLAEDHADSALILCEGLKLHNIEAVHVSTGEAALDMCTGGKIDLLLLDVKLPGIDGFEVCRRLKDNPETAQIPVVFVTVKGAREDVELGYRLGAADYVTKPYNLPMILLRIESVLADHGVTGEDGALAEIMRDSSYTDQLTGLRNKQYLLDRLQEEVDKAHRYDVPMSCVVFDVDEIVAVDDETGPVSADDLLAEVALSLRTATRATDILARFDGTMFAAVLPHTELDAAVGYCTKIFEDVDSTTFSDPNFPTKARLSAGVVSCRNGSARNAEYVLGEAMRNLFHAKGLSGTRIKGRRLQA